MTNCGGAAITGSAIEVYRARVIATALDLYARTGMRVNKAYTPIAMLKVANQLTGRAYKRGQYAAAACALRELADKLADQPRSN